MVGLTVVKLTGLAVCYCLVLGVLGMCIVLVVLEVIVTAVGVILVLVAHASGGSNRRNTNNTGYIFPAIVDKVSQAKDAAQVNFLQTLSARMCFSRICVESVPEREYSA